jgi:transposase-like protein
MKTASLSPIIRLTPSEQRILTDCSRSRTSAYRAVQRARIILMLDTGGTITQVALRLGVSRNLVRRWRDRFLEKRLDGL